MKLKLLTAAALAFSLAAAPVAFAQSGDASGNSNQPTVKTDEGTTSSVDNSLTDADKKFYSENQMFSGFFTDDSMATVKSEAEVTAAFQAMGAEDQAGVKAACQKVQDDRGSHGSVTIALCQQVGAL
jgi:ABC-type oligopeptide transport system substrate-binding subunit